MKLLNVYEMTNYQGDKYSASSISHGWVMGMDMYDKVGNLIHTREELVELMKLQEVYIEEDQDE